MMIFEQLLLPPLLVGCVFGIVNLDQQTANPIFATRRHMEREPGAARSGIDCLHEFSKLYLRKRENMTRSPNMVITSARNMSMAADQIQAGFLKLTNEAIVRGEITQRLYQVRVISDVPSMMLTNIQQTSGLLLADYYVIVVDSIERLKMLLKISAKAMNSWNPGARFLVLYNNAEERECIKLHRRYQYLYDVFNQNETEEIDDRLKGIASEKLPESRAENATLNSTLKDDDRSQRPKLCEYRNQSETIMEIYKEMLKKYYIHRIAILYASDNFNYTLSSIDYFNKKSCRTIIAQRLGTCHRGKMDPKPRHVKKHIDRLQNHMDLRNCTFHVCASIAAPFVEEDCDAGLELRIIGVIKNRLGLNLDYNCRNESRGVEKQGNWTGLLGRLKIGECDFIIGGYYPDDGVASKFWTSDCYLDDSHTWYVKLADERPAWMAVYTIFNATTWHYLLLMTPITWIFWYFLVKILPEPEKHTEFSLVGMNNLGISICAAINERPICHASRILWLTLAIYGMNISSIYTSRLISVFSNPGYLHQIDNLEEVIEAGLPFGGYEESRDWFENEEDMWVFQHYNDTELFEPNGQNMKDVRDGKRVILSSRMYVTQLEVSDNIFAFPGNIFRSPLQMIMKPGFPFMFEINRLLGYMRDAGIFSFLKDRFYFNNTYLNRIARERPQFKTSQIVITTEHLEGPFSLLIFGIIISCVTCLIEVLVHRCSNRARERTTTVKEKVKKVKSKRSSSPYENRGKKSSGKPKKLITRRIKFKVNNAYGANMYDGKVQHGIRFTPIMRRNPLKHHSMKNIRARFFQVKLSKPHYENLPHKITTK